MVLAVLLEQQETVVTEATRFLPRLLQLVAVVVVDTPLLVRLVVLVVEAARTTAGVLVAVMALLAKETMEVLLVGAQAAVAVVPVLLAVMEAQAVELLEMVGQEPLPLSLVHP